jgi:LuxR family transcriptional regulator, maltose regulon positive regulatory protein
MSHATRTKRSAVHHARAAASVPAPLLDSAAERRRRLPSLRGGTLRRERLLRRLAQTSDVPLTLVVAPAGYGKTTLLVHWLDRDPRTVAWVSIDESDNDPARLGASIALAVRESGAPGSLEPRLRVAPEDGAAAIVAELAGALQQPERPFVLVLDDVHRLHARAAVKALCTIADAVPHGSQLVLASRREPALPIGRLRAEGRLIDLRQSDLVMTRREATTMLSLAGLELPAEDVLVLLERTEGWPAGLYLASLSLRGRQDMHRAVSRFGGDDRLMADYVRDELLGALEEDQRAFLRRTSVLDSLSGELCDAVLESWGSGEVLRNMSRSNVLMIPLDSADATYRYHAVLARMLQAELGRVEPQFEADLHRRASRWYAAVGDVDHAVSHAIQGGDLAHVGELLWRSAGERVLDGHTAELRRWLDRLSRDDIAERPTIALTAAAGHLAEGDLARIAHWTATAARRIGDDDDASVRAGIAMMDAVVAPDGIARMASDAKRAYEELADDSPWRSLCCLLQGVGEFLGDDPQPARARLEEGARRGAVAGRCVQVLCMAQLALMAIEQGDWEQGPLLASRARAQTERMDLSDYPTCALVYAVSALVRAHRGRVEDAQADRRRATELLTMLVDYVPWYEIETRIVLARAALRLGDVTGTRTLLGEASRMLARTSDAIILRRWIDELWSHVETFTATALVGPSSLTTAELRVLALMPTHLSFGEMGRRLHVSANTVKTHAHAVYRKLDVCSRSEAVVRAAETGLLDVEA